MSEYILAIDQSTQGTKALLFDGQGELTAREDLSHRQIVNEDGWVSHDPMEIYYNTLRVIQNLITHTKIDKSRIACIGISNQRETSLIWDKKTGLPLAPAIVWQCARASSICKRVEEAGFSGRIQEKTGLKLSPYFPAAKLAWFLENVPEVRQKAERGEVYFGTMDTWLLYKLTEGKSYKTDYSNASRTQLYNIFTLQWDREICEIFGLNPEELAEVCDSDSCFGETTLEGDLDTPTPVRAMLGDSHGALFGQGCLTEGTVKATYGTGSSIMMNVGETPLLSSHGLVTSLAWKLQGKLHYVLEGNINYTGAVMSWLRDEAQLISGPEETEGLCRQACKEDELYFIPAFTGLGAPYWKPRVKAALLGIGRTTGKKEIVRAGVESIAYQIADVLEAMSKDAGLAIKTLRADGGPTKNAYLMQFQSDVLRARLQVSKTEELSGMGAAYAAGLSMGILPPDIFERKKAVLYKPVRDREETEKKYAGWKKAVSVLLSGPHTEP